MLASGPHDVCPQGLAFLFILLLSLAALRVSAYAPLHSSKSSERETSSGVKFPAKVPGFPGIGPSWVTCPCQIKDGGREMATGCRFSENCSAYHEWRTRGRRSFK
jgi:hypothetical protein